MAAKHYRSAAKNNVLEMEETSSSQDAVQFTHSLSVLYRMQGEGEGGSGQHFIHRPKKKKRLFLRGRFFSNIEKINLRTPINTHGYR